MSADLPFIDQHARSPQTWNLFVYARNNPLGFVDPTGNYSEKSANMPPMEGTGDDAAPTWVSEAADSAGDTELTAAARAQNQMSLSSQGLAFIERHGGYSDKVYNDVAGNPTIGYGHLIKEGEDFSKGITKEKATELLAQDTKSAVDTVNSKVTGKLSQTKFDALVDFTYNLGGKSLGKSTLLKNINGGKEVIKENFTDWNRAGGKVVKGLTIRRTDEFNLFSKGSYGGP